MQQSQNVKLKLNSSECISSNFDKYQEMVQSRTEQYHAPRLKNFFLLLNSAEHENSNSYQRTFMRFVGFFIVLTDCFSHNGNLVIKSSIHALFSVLNFAKLTKVCARSTA